MLFANDHANVAATDRGNPRGVAIAIADQLDESRSDAWLDTTDLNTVRLGDQSIAKNDQLDQVARIYLRERSSIGNIRQRGEPGGARLLNEDAGGRCRPLGARGGLLADLLNEALQALKVALCNTIEWIKREGCLVLPL